MKHLTVDEIIQFVSLTELNDEALALSVVVNSHIRRCKECLNLVRAFRLLYEEFSRIENGGEFAKLAKEMWAECMAQNAQAQEQETVMEYIDNMR